MAKVKTYKSGVNHEIPFKIVNGNIKYTLELSVKEMSCIYNALNEFRTTALYKGIPKMQKEYKKLQLFFLEILEK